MLKSRLDRFQIRAHCIDMINERAPISCSYFWAYL